MVADTVFAFLRNTLSEAVRKAHAATSLNATPGKSREIAPGMLVAVILAIISMQLVIRQDTFLMVKRLTVPASLLAYSNYESYNYRSYAFRLSSIVE